MKKEYKVGILGFGFMGKAHTFGYDRVIHVPLAHCL